MDNAKKRQKITEDDILIYLSSKLKISTWRFYFWSKNIYFYSLGKKISLSTIKWGTWLKKKFFKNVQIS